MATMVAAVKIEREGIVASLEEAERQLGAAEGDLVLDLTPVRGLDAAGVRAMKQLADAAGAKGVKIALRGVNVEIYRVLKLLELTPRFSFLE